jgi:hypothetical protein
VLVTPLGVPLAHKLVGVAILVTPLDAPQLPAIGALTNVALTARLLLILKLQLKDEPLQSPPQALKTLPLAGCAVSVTLVL